VLQAVSLHSPVSPPPRSDARRQPSQRRPLRLPNRWPPAGVQTLQPGVSPLALSSTGATQLELGATKCRTQLISPRSFATACKAKTNQYGGLERRKARLAIRGDHRRPDVDFDLTCTAAHMPSQTGRRLLLAAAVAEEHAFFCHVRCSRGAHAGSGRSSLSRRHEASSSVKCVAQVPWKNLCPPPWDARGAGFECHVGTTP
jgi:hypothetical protein